MNFAAGLLADGGHTRYDGESVEDSHDETDVFGVTPVLEVFEVVDKFGFGEVALYGELAEVQWICETLNELGNVSAIPSSLGDPGAGGWGAERLT